MNDIREYLGFEIEVEPDSHWVNYKIYIPFSAKTGARELFIYGSVKWDGCSNWIFNENAKNMMVHACSKEELEQIGQILAACWDLTAEYIPETWLG